MTWEADLQSVFEDLEQQAEGLLLEERDLEVAERARAEYATVTLASRLRASLGTHTSVRVLGVGVLDGELRRIGPDWLLLAADRPPTEWIVRTAALSRVRGASARSLDPSAHRLTGRLGLRSVLRGLAEMRAPVQVHHLDGTQSQGHLARVGEDFVELVAEARTTPVRRASAPAADLIPYAGIGAVRSVLP